MHYIDSGVRVLNNYCEKRGFHGREHFKSITQLCGGDMLFSQRVGIKPIKSVLQVESMDDDLRNGLWNAILKCFFSFFDYSKDGGWVSNSKYAFILEVLWKDFYKACVDSIPQHTEHAIAWVRKDFFNRTWHEVYDIVDFLPNIQTPEPLTNIEVNHYFIFKYKSADFITICNEILEREVAGYRFLKSHIEPITDKISIESIETALNKVSKSNSFSGVRIHLETALSLFGDRKAPDYRNSIKESISSIESVCQVISGDPKAELGKALKKISGSIALHPSLEQCFAKMYGYTSDSNGIRHALLEEPNLGYEDALYMLVVCSAFVNYLFVKADKAGIKL